MLKEERQTWILNKLHTSGKVVVSHLAGELKVSEDTIRRDLLDLDQKGQLKRVFGGAIPLEKPVINFFDRETADVALKQQLAMRALEFLEPDQLVAIDGSSTNLLSVAVQVTCILVQQKESHVVTTLEVS